MSKCLYNVLKQLLLQLAIASKILLAETSGYFFSLCSQLVLLSTSFFGVRKDFPFPAETWLLIIINS